jgi:hypothetical protein
MGPRAGLGGYGEQKTYTNLTTNYLHGVFVFIIRNCYMFRLGQVAIFVECILHVDQTFNSLKMARMYGRNM